MNVPTRITHTFGCYPFSDCFVLFHSHTPEIPKTERSKNKKGKWFWTGIYPFDRPPLLLLLYGFGLPFSDELMSRCWCWRCAWRRLVLWFCVRPFSLILFASSRFSPFILLERGTPTRAGDIDTNLRDIDGGVVWRCCCRGCRGCLSFVWPIACDLVGMFVVIASSSLLDGRTTIISIEFLKLRYASHRHAHTPSSLLVLFLSFFSFFSLFVRRYAHAHTDMHKFAH